MATEQAKRLKRAFKNAGINATVRTERKYIGVNPMTGKADYEYGDVVGHLPISRGHPITESEEKKMQEIDHNIEAAGKMVIRN